jgi:hypothetical protein
MDACVMDVGLTGDANFAQAFADAPETSASLEIEPKVACDTQAECPAGAACVAPTCGAAGDCVFAPACDLDSGPVCGCGGVTHENACAAYAQGSVAHSPNACPPLDLLLWSRQGAASNGSWQVAADGQSVLQTINGAPSFYVSPNDFIDTTIRGSFRVETTADDDFIGFVLGFRAPLTPEEAANNTFDFIVLDWKQTAQNEPGLGSAAEGFTLARVQGTLADPSAALWSHAAPAITVLATDHGGTRGWTENQDHQFEVFYESDRIRISIDGSQIFDVPGTFAPGRFGFYNYSQAQVRYRDFTATAGDSAP